MIKEFRKKLNQIDKKLDLVIEIERIRANRTLKEAKNNLKIKEKRRT